MEKALSIVYRGGFLLFTYAAVWLSLVIFDFRPDSEAKWATLSMILGVIMVEGPDALRRWRATGSLRWNDDAESEAQ